MNLTFKKKNETFKDKIIRWLKFTGVVILTPVILILGIIYYVFILPIIFYDFIRSIFRPKYNITTWFDRDSQ